MNRFISNFNTETEYAAAQSTLERPHTSLTRDDMEVHYDPYVPLTNNVITYTATGKLPEKTTSGTAGIKTDAFNTTIKSHTFENGVGTVEFNDTLTSMGADAFGHMSTYYSPNAVLTSITIPPTVTSVAQNTFNESSALATLTITDYATYTLNKNTNINGFRGCYITLANGEEVFISLYFHFCCFVAGTQVTMGDLTTKNIENVQVGDRVLSYDLDNNANIVTTVKRTIIHENTTDIATITLENGYTATMNEYHPILCSDGWHSITNYNGYPTLAEGDMVKTQEGYSRLVALQRTVVEPFITYNLDVVENHEVENDVDINDNYYANGICAHNAC